MTISAIAPVYDLSVETIYLDSLFALNAVIDYFLLLCSARAAGAVLRRWRLALAAVLGGAWAVACVLPGMGFLTYAPMKLVPAVFMALIAFGGERRLWRCLVIFLAVSAAFGGAVWAASMLAGTDAYGGQVYVPVSMRVLGKSVALRALRDTGNGLSDPVSGRAAAVAELEALRPLLPGLAPGVTDPAALCEALAALPYLAGRVSLLPYSALGTGYGLIAALRPDFAEVSGRREDILIGLSPAPLSRDGDYDAII